MDLRIRGRKALAEEMLGAGPGMMRLGKVTFQAAAQTDSILVFSVCALNGLTI